METYNVTKFILIVLVMTCIVSAILTYRREKNNLNESWKLVFALQILLWISFILLIIGRIDIFFTIMR